MLRIREARDDEFARLNEIETVADEAFAAVGLEIVLGMSNATHERLRRGPVWAACDDADRPIGFALAGRIDDFALLDQLSVMPDFARRGIGAALVRRVEDWGRHEGFDALVLSTYRGVAWNQPYYERLGFSEMPASAWGDGIRALRQGEREAGHDLDRRVVMWKRLA
mgnify:CR=1 FL=1